MRVGRVHEGRDPDDERQRLRQRVRRLHPRADLAGLHDAGAGERSPGELPHPELRRLRQVPQPVGGSEGEEAEAKENIEATFEPESTASTAARRAPSAGADTIRVPTTAASATTAWASAATTAAAWTSAGATASTTGSATTTASASVQSLIVTATADASGVH